jgi:sugar lactone lactonase YvrE
MNALNAELVLDARAALGECPLWHAGEQVLYWVDISGKRVHRFDPVAQTSMSWETPTEPGCIALARAGLVVACRDGFYRFNREKGLGEKIAESPYDQSCMRFNDGKVDAKGRFWIGAMYEPRTEERASMFVLQKGCAREAWGPAQSFGVKVSNGLAFDVARGVVYQADTPNHVTYRFAFDIELGTVSQREVFFRRDSDKNSPEYAGRPDGAALDSLGNYWSAQYEGGRVVCYSPQGEVLREVMVPARRTTMVAFGGADFHTLYITTAREGASDEELARYPHAGGVFAVQLASSDAPGQAEPFYLD